MKTHMDLKQLGPRFAVLDRHLVSVFANREELAARVAAEKIPTRQEIVRPKVEKSRLRVVRKLAHQLGLDPDIYGSVFAILIGESCKLQTVLYQRADKTKRKTAEPTDDAELQQFYRKNLLALTKGVAATYDEQYDRAYFATHAYVEYEMGLVEREVAQLRHQEVVLDLGCATGRMTMALAGRFNKAIGYDISPHMLQVARKRATQQGITNVTYERVDLEGALPLSNASVSFVIMNMGTASDVRNLEGLLKEVRRVLRPGGRFLFSFYNREALIYAWDFLPWPVGLAAEINLALNCLEVHKRGTILSIYAHPYTVEDAAELFQKGMSPTEVSTYPTISAILPHDLLHMNPDAQKQVTAIDKTLAASNKGAYIVVTGVRN